MMTREVAIHIFENSRLVSEYFTSEALTATYVMALSALRPVSREQVERMQGEWKVCFEDWRKQMAGDQCSKCGFQHYGTSINHYNFCPFCMAPMTDEAVEMVLERLEALKDGNSTD